MSVGVASRVQFSHAIGQLSQRGRGFNNPVDVAVGDGNRLYVLNRSNIAHAEMSVLRVSIVTMDEEFVDQFTTFGEGDGQLIWPTALAYDRVNGRVYVSDERRNDVQVFDRDGAFLHKWGKLGSGSSDLNRPSGLAVDPQGNVLVADALNHRVQRRSTDGEVLATWGEPGTGPGQFNMPWGIAADREGRVYVSDWRNSRVQQFSPDGDYLATFGGPGDGEGSLDRPSGVGVDSVGNVYVSDFGRDCVQVYAPDGSHLTRLLGDATITKWGRVYVSVDPEMSELRTRHAKDVDAQERVFEGPIGIAVDDEDRVIVADCCKHRIQVYQRV
jgi:DNA-binding beta-propeller fold protein YncE